MKPIEEIKLSFECRENWNDFKQVPGGRLCEKCKHIVHDFTNSTPDEVAEAMKKNPGRICGRFRTSQPKSAFLKRAAVVTASVALGACLPDVNSVTPENNLPLNEDLYFMDSVELTIDSAEVETFETMGIVFTVDSTLNEMQP